MQSDIFQPSDGNWGDYARHGGLRSVIDPNDTMGIKNATIDELHRIAIRKHARLGPRSVVLDFGCGTGRISRDLAATADIVLGIDITFEMLLGALQQPNPSNVHYHRFDGSRLALADDSVDMIVTACVLQYFVHQTDVYRSVLREFERVLKPGGTCLLLEQVSFSSEHSGSLREKTAVEDYTDWGDGSSFALAVSRPVRVGRHTRLERQAMRAWIPRWLRTALLELTLKRNASLSPTQLARQPYVDWLFVLEYLRARV